MYSTRVMKRLSWCGSWWLPTAVYDLGWSTILRIIDRPFSVVSLVVYFHYFFGGINEMELRKSGGRKDNSVGESLSKPQLLCVQLVWYDFICEEQADSLQHASEQLSTKSSIEWKDAELLADSTERTPTRAILSVCWGQWRRCHEHPDTVQ